MILGLVLVTGVPLLLLAAGLIPASILNRNHLRAARLGETVALAAFAAAVLGAIAFLFAGPFRLDFIAVGPFRFGVYFDNLSAIMLVLVTFLLLVVLRYSRNSLAGDRGQGRFTKWLCLTGGSVLSIVVSGNLIQFALAWSATSFCLHQLLVFYPDRPGALLAARKKFVISRLGDLCLLGVIVLSYRQFHTWDFQQIFALAGGMPGGASPLSGPEVSGICFLLVAGAMMKSAQFPFHSWLPDTMETPTPVSALMHAGIINAGGFLIIRMSPLVVLSPFALFTLALFGAFTALFASLVMLTHASVKRSLAFSTVAQMGFMMLECGLGAFSLAILHMVAHSLYKAHAFLSSGSVHRMEKGAWVPSGMPVSMFRLASAVLTSIGLTLLSAQAFRIDLLGEPGGLVLGCTFMMAISYMLWNLWGELMTIKRTVTGILLGGLLGAGYFSLHHIFSNLLGPFAIVTPPASGLGLAIAAMPLALFTIALLIQTELPLRAAVPMFQALYVHARNGFYFNTLANRAIALVWPLKNQWSKES